MGEVDHGQGHDHHGHGSTDADRRSLFAALVLLVAFMAFEVGAAVFANSLALLADAGHMLVDVGAIACSLLAINLAATVTVSRANRQSLNIEGAYRHILTDLYGFAGTLIAGIVIVATGFDRADAVASLVVVLLMLGAAVRLLRPAVRILLEATPEDIDLEEVRRHLVELPEVQSVHDLHAWTLTSSLPILTAHVVVTDECFRTGDAGRVLDHLQDCLSGHFDVAHSTLQFEAAGHLEHELGGHT